jgi:predicted ribosomally synthesized peptide with nif11-like leader
MSKENVKLFYEALGKDKALQEKSRAIGKKYEGQKQDDVQSNLIYQEELVPLAKEAGYDFTLAELKEYAQECEKSGMREVSEEELAAVAGGKCCVCALVGVGNIISQGGDPYGDQVCNCIGYGSGNWAGGGVNCVCVLGGGGG